jgi:phage terminase small subunit
MSKGRNLTTKQRLFVEAYLVNPNATEAARRAGYKGNDVTLGAVGGENLKKPLIAALISERVEKAVMSADEVLQRLTEHATASLADLLDDEGRFDLEKAKREGKDHLMKKLKVRRNIATSGTGNEFETVTYEYEIHDPQAALVHLGKYHKLFTEKIEHGGKVAILSYADLAKEAEKELK